MSEEDLEAAEEEADRPVAEAGEEDDLLAAEVVAEEALEEALEAAVVAAVVVMGVGE
eukprot:CAMPEP_0172525452 /NCGR_PEP_ID=MMETSP1067-20121228/477_1 /TAXON_ID=265564 ORGANISM="Thalassiosira punctigera, Strain Tpunct2005C2" /NCGR_SAMPLE_ID=MMETSP1067 /ASSEMBLY_ACC=CAM_ASM_000444 /LENGTH=56 /DNA_ID=CAMNT_0013308705 /DNA_START=110 /DNA_END=278 /DNA_ORIENTATION=+